MSKPITVVFNGEDTGAVKAFHEVGSASTSMASNVQTSTSSFDRLEDSSRLARTGLKGTNALMGGLSVVLGSVLPPQFALIGGFAQIATGVAKLAPTLGHLTTAFPQLAGAMTLISAHPLVAGLLIGGAIIVGLVLLEKKFGLISGAVHGLGDAMNAAWNNGIKPAINLIIGGVELLARAWALPFTLLSKIPGVGNLIPSGLANISLPRLDVGGTVLQTGVAVVHRGEVVSPAVGSPSRAAGGTIIIQVAGSVISERELIDAVHEGLLDKQRRSGSLGIAA